MKTTDRVECPGCKMFTSVHEMKGKADGVHVCDPCAMQYVRRTWGEKQLEVPNDGLRLVCSKAGTPLPAQVARERHAA